MFVNIFPKQLHGLLRRTFKYRHISVMMQPLISVVQYRTDYSNNPDATPLFSTKELAIVDQYKLTKRQNEWLTGRLCSKLAATDFILNSSNHSDNLRPDQLNVENDATGRPFISTPARINIDNIEVSLTHGAGYAIALVTDSPCGIDIEAPRPTLLKVREKFSTFDEAQKLLLYFSDIDELHQLTLLWTAKEAVKKALGKTRMPGFQEIILLELEPHSNGWLLTFLLSSNLSPDYPATIQVVAELYQKHAIAATIAVNPNA